MASNNSIKKTLTVALALCIVCSVVVSTAAVVLQPTQQKNQELDRKSNILQVANLYEPGMDVDDAFDELITPRVINLEPVSTATVSIRKVTISSMPRETLRHHAPCPVKRTVRGLGAKRCTRRFIW